MEEITLESGVLRIHAKEECAGPCPVHAPSAHHMIAWPLYWRGDRAIFERICPHGIGHPDPDTLNFITTRYGADEAKYEAIHGCDGCCSKGITDGK